jgi:hypothetical protein
MSRYGVFFLVFCHIVAHLASAAKCMCAGVKRVSSVLSVSVSAFVFLPRQGGGVHADADERHGSEPMQQEMFSDFSSKKQVRGLLDAISRFKYQLPKEA